MKRYQDIKISSTDNYMKKMKMSLVKTNLFSHRKINSLQKLMACQIDKIGTLLSFFEKMLDTEFANIYTNKACEQASTIFALFW